MGGLAKVVDDIALILGLHLEPWMAPAAFILLGILFLPWILPNMRTASARKLLKRSAIERGERRAELERQAMALVAGNPYGALALAEEAAQAGRYPLARTLLEGLPAKPDVQKQRQRLLKLMEPPGPKTPLEAAITVERLREEGMAEEAERRLADALRRWPGDAELARLA